MAVYVDLINTGSLRETQNGFDAVTEYLVTGVTGNADRVRLNALQHPDVPRLGTPHPVAPNATVVDREVIPVQDSPSKWIVRIRYETVTTEGEGDGDGGEFGPVTWSGSTRTEEEQTYFDVYGNPMIVRYRGTPTVDTINRYTGELAPQKIRGYINHTIVDDIAIAVPRPVIRGERFERTNPEHRSIEYHGTVNRDNWRGYRPETMLLREISFAEQPDGGYRTTYAFHYNPDTWRHVAAIRVGSGVGLVIPHDAVRGNGFEEYQIYRPVSFAALGLG